MKVVQDSNAAQDASEAKAKSEQILSLRETDRKKLEKGQYLEFNLLSNPSEPTSQRYNFKIGYLKGGESVRDVIYFYKDIKKVWEALPATQPDDKRRIVTSLLQGHALTTFQTGVNTSHEASYITARQTAALAAETTARAAGSTDDEIRTARENAWNATARPDLTVENVEYGMRSLISYACPQQALTKVKRYLRRYCRKPADMKFREYVSNLNRINREEIPFLPPFDPNQYLPDDEMVDIIMFGIPASWKNEMERQGFNPFETIDLLSLGDFCERLEGLPEFQHVPRKDKSSKKDKKKSANGNDKSGKPKGNSDKSSKYCEVHGAYGHSTAECRLVKKAKRGGESYSSDGEKGSDNKSKNKTWTRKADEAKKKQKKELAALVAAAVKKEMNAFSDAKKKRKSDDESSDEEGYLAEALDSKLQDFNYEDMENLKIDSDDDSVSV